jgi:chromosome partitioning protein
MKVITVSSIKGGTGKTTTSILVANALSSEGYRVLVIDMDIQNSLSFYYLDNAEVIEEKNIAFALHSGKLKENILSSNYKGVDIIPSSFTLVDLRALSPHKLKRLIEKEELPYDFIIIDTAPTYDNIVLNALNASDLIISPSKASQFDYKGLLFFREKLLTETDKVDCWKILMTFNRNGVSRNPENLTSQYKSLFETTFDNILPMQIPATTMINKIIDAGEVLSEAKTKVKLHRSIKELAGFIAEKELEVVRW